jgi:hypothetical protein
MDLEDLAHQGVAVDDDNVPAPENNTLPTAGAAPPVGT